MNILFCLCAQFQLTTAILLLSKLAPSNFIQKIKVDEINAIPHCTEGEQRRPATATAKGWQTQSQN